jgi:hypothetical protein
MDDALSVPEQPAMYDAANPQPVGSVAIDLEAANFWPDLLQL